MLRTESTRVMSFIDSRGLASVLHHMANGVAQGFPPRRPRKLAARPPWLTAIKLDLDEGGERRIDAKYSCETFIFTRSVVMLGGF